MKRIDKDKLKRMIPASRNKFWNGIQNLIIALVLGVIALIPTWIFILFESMLHPEGFWQMFAFIALSVSILGAPQLMLIVVYIATMIVIISD